MSPDPLLIAWRGRQLRVRHDDPRTGPMDPVGERIRATVELATDFEGLRMVLASTVGERYRVRVAEDGLRDCGEGREATGLLLRGVLHRITTRTWSVCQPLPSPID